MPKLGELNFKDPSPDAQLKKNDDDDIGVIRSTLSGIASGVFGSKLIRFWFRY